MPVHLVSCIDVKDFGAETLRVGDLNGDGAPDLLLVQSEYGRRSITCLTALTIDGRVLWQVGSPSARLARSRSCSSISIVVRLIMCTYYRASSYISMAVAGIAGQRWMLIT